MYNAIVADLPCLGQNNSETIKRFNKNPTYNYNKSFFMYNQMDKKVIKVVIIIVLLFSLVGQCFTKRTGHNSNNNDSPKGKSWNPFSWFSRGHKKTHNKKQKPSFFGGLINFMDEIYNYMWKFSIIVFFIKCGRQLYQIFQQNHLKEEEIKVFEQFKEACLVEPSVYNYNQQETIIQELREKMFVMSVVQSKDGLMALNSRLNINSINRLTDIAFSVGLEGSDELGRCRMDGFLGFTRDGFKIRLVKKKEVQLPTQQKDNDQRFIFQGFGNVAEVSGQWLQIGHQNDSKYSGTWTWVSQTQKQ